MEGEQGQQNQKKISLPEIIILGMLFGLTDLVEFLADLLATTVVLAPVVLIISYIFKGISWLAMFVWLIIKGIKGIWLIAGSLLNTIPIVDALPILTATFLLTVFLVNRPVNVPGFDKAVQLAGKAGKLAK